MNVDFRFLRQSALGVCGVALLALLFGGCVSLHKPRFWDKDDVTTASTSGDSDSQKNKKPSTDPATDAKAAPTVVAADHSTSDDPSGHISVFDFSDPSPTVSSRPNASTSDLQPASKSSSLVSNSNDDPFASTVPPSLAVEGLANTPHAASIAKTSAVPTKELDPFADATQPFVPPAAAGVAMRSSAASSSKTSKSSDAFADLGGSASADVHAPLAQPESQPLAKPAPAPAPIQPEAIEQSSAMPQPSASPQPAVPTPPAAVQAQPAASEPPLSPEPLPAMPADPQPASTSSVHDQTAIVAPVKQNQNVTDDAFADPAPTRPSQTRQPAVSRDVAQSPPSCAVPANKTATADKTVAAPTAMAADALPAKPAVSEAWATVPAPPSSEQVTSTNALNASPETSKPDIRRHEPTPPPAVRTSASEGAGVPNPMICDSKLVRGRFTGADASAGKSVHQSPPKDAQSKPSPNGVPMSCTDADPFCPQAAQDEDASSHTAHGPKPLGRVVNAVAHRIGRASVADPFALEQAVDTSAVDPISIGDGRTQPPNTQGPRPFSAEQTGDGSASAELMAVDATVAPDPPREETRINRETWFGVGIGVGLAASLALWLRSRPKNERVLNG